MPSARRQCHNKTAIVFQVNDVSATAIAYRQLHPRVCRLANASRAALRAANAQ
ncbi:hypothetical protein [Paraburkholderia sprentiae]|uniref:hypothetical protein n=1 Tax=Paraburkholderia sprentiae TaxID=948107 RepID=UPI0004245875|nr:hypothetical protein [Paraburkholderia sprentiae]